MCRQVKLPARKVLASVVLLSIQSALVQGQSQQQQTPDKTPLIQLPPVTVTATRQSRDLLQTPANVASVTTEELDRRMDNVIEDVFRYEPGIEVFRQSTGADPFSSSGGIQIRGVGGNRTQVLVDGNRTIETITDSTRDVVDSSNVKVVEVVRGPSSTLWGSDSLGGVVNFVTKDPFDYLTDASDFAGNIEFDHASVDNAITGSAAVASRLSTNLEALLTYTHREAEEIELRNARNQAGALQECTRNPQATPCNEFDPLDISSDNLLGKLVWYLSENNQLRFTGEYFTRDTDVEQNSVLGPGSFNTFINSYDRSQEISRWRFSVDQEWSPDDVWFDHLNWHLTYSPQEVNRNGDRRRINGSGDQEQRLDRQEYGETFIEADIQLVSTFKLGTSSHTLTYGFDGDLTETDYERVDITRNLTRGTETVSRAGGFNFADADTLRADFYIQDEIGLFDDRLQLIPGVRIAHFSLDPNPDADYQVAPGAEPDKVDDTSVQFKIGAIYQIDDTFSVYAQYAEGFKMPTAQQLYQSIDSLPFFALVPNPDLEPESVDNYEIGLRGNFAETGYFSVNVFLADYDDFILNFIETDPIDFGLPPGALVLTYDNVETLEVYGMEASAGFQFNDNFSTRLSMSYQKGTLEDDGGEEENYNGALPLKAVLGLRYIKPEIGADIELMGTFQRGANDVENPEFSLEPPGYVVFDLIAGWDITDNVKLKASINNLFDRRYFNADAKGFPINRNDDTKRVNPVELQTAPGRNFKLGFAYQF